MNLRREIWTRDPKSGEAALREHTFEKRAKGRTGGMSVVKGWEGCREACDRGRTRMGGRVACGC